MKDMFKVLKEKNCQPKILCPSKVSSRKIKAFSSKQELTECDNSRRSFYKTLQEMFQAQSKGLRTAFQIHKLIRTIILKTVKMHTTYPLFS